jgi:hypothetical protein
LSCFFKRFGVLVGGGTIVAVVGPQHLDVRLRLRREMQDDGFVRAIIGRDDGAAVGLRDGPLHDVERGLVPQFGVGFGDLFGRHG